MDDFDVHLRRYQGTGYGGVHVADQQHVGRFVAQTDLFKSLHDLGGLFGMGQGTDLQVDVRYRDAEVVKEELRLFFIIVLAGMHEQERHPAS